MRTHAVDLEAELFGLTHRATKGDTVQKHQIATLTVPLGSASSRQLTTEQSRATHPTWWYRDLAVAPEHRDFPLFDPQQHTFLHFENGLDTHILEKNKWDTKPKP
jgi:hypothetical protein